MTKLDTLPTLSLPSPSTPIRLPDDVPQYVMDMPSDMTAACLSALARRQLGATHPAATLKAMNDKLHALMIAEGEREAMLYRQSSVLDALFHTLLNDAICDKVNNNDDIAASPAPFSSDSPPLSSNSGPVLRANILAAALKSQSLCVETVKTIHHIGYLNALKTRMGTKAEDKI